MLRSVLTLLAVQLLALDNVAKFVQCRKVLYGEEISARPKCEVVEPVIDAHVVHNLDAQKSGNPYMKVLAYGKTVKHYLTPNKGLFASKYTPVFTSFVVNDEVRYQREKNICIDGECLDDPEPNNVAWNPGKQSQVEPWTLETECPICPAI